MTSVHSMRLSMPDLSIIIPVLNEATTLGSLFSALESQCGLVLEIIFSVSCSCDGSEALLAEYATKSKHKVVVVPSVKGRAVQMNCGADAASGDLLLFLHADSFWQEPYLLRDAVDFFNTATQHMQTTLVAGHFCLKFEHCGRNKLFYRYLSEKAALNRGGTIYGDQGMLITRNLWHEVGQFCEDVFALEDVLFAEAVAHKATWILLPQLITTSARRYCHDGILLRIVVNALLVIAGSAGLLKRSPTSKLAYPAGASDHEYAVCQLLEQFALRLHSLPLGQYLAFWYTGSQVMMEYSWFMCYACGWLLPFADSQLRITMLAVHDRYVLPLLNKPLCFSTLGLCSWMVFYVVYLFVVYPGAALCGLSIHNSKLGELHDL